MFNRFCVTVLFLIMAISSTFAQDKQKTESEAVAQTLRDYAAAIQSMDMSVVAKYVVNSDDFTMFEGGHVNRGWVDYRDNHLVPEFKEFLDFKYNVRDIEVRLFGDVAYSTQKYSIYIKMKDREVEFDGLATVVLTKQEGKWRIRHMHTSRIPKHEH